MGPSRINKIKYACPLSIYSSAQDLKNLSKAQTFEFYAYDIYLTTEASSSIDLKTGREFQLFSYPKLP